MLFNQYVNYSMIIENSNDTAVTEGMMPSLTAIWDWICKMVKKNL